jgi:hypothetical protein
MGRRPAVPVLLAYDRDSTWTVACERHGAGDVAGRQHLWAVSRVPRPAGDSGLAGSVGSGVIDGFLFFLRRHQVLVFLFFIFTGDARFRARLVMR